MGIDYHIHAFVKQDSYSTEMDYPSTTQALFALVVMIIVLLFIMVYCCSGAFPCNNNQDQDASSMNANPQRRIVSSNRSAITNSVRSSTALVRGNSGTRTTRHSSVDREISVGNSESRRTLVIVPVNGMLYYRQQQEVDRSSQIMSLEKPPAYSELFCPPPPYSMRTVTPSPTNDCARPPPYEESFKDWKLTLNNDNRFDNLINENRTQNNSSFTQAINELINETSRPNILIEPSSVNENINMNLQTTRNFSYSPSNVTAIPSHTAIQMEMTQDHTRSQEHSNDNSDTTNSYSDLESVNSSMSSYGRSSSLPRCPNNILNSTINSFSDLESADSPSSLDGRSSSSSPTSSSTDQEQSQSTTTITRDNELILTVPVSDVYTLIRVVTSAEQSRRGNRLLDQSIQDSESPD